MARGKRQVHNRPNRRIAPLGAISDEILANLKDARYVGSPHHKSRPADYGFDPPVSPRPAKSRCDGLRPIDKAEAVKLFRAGVRLGMVSMSAGSGLPDYVWAVDRYGEAYEALLGTDGPNYHGFRLEPDAANHAAVVAEWKRRNEPDHG